MVYDPWCCKESDMTEVTEHLPVASSLGCTGHFLELFSCLKNIFYYEPIVFQCIKTFHIADTCLLQTINICLMKFGTNGRLIYKQ